ncbi:MAG: hypothetical protein ACLFVJ_10420 [Persicimonas sp.]
MIYRTLAIVAAVLMMAAGCRTAQVESEDREPAEQQQDEQSEAELVSSEAVPTGTPLQVELDQELNTEDTEVGERFSATLVQSLRDAEGNVVVPAGAKVHGTVTGLKKSDRHGEQAAIRLDVQELELEDRTYAMQARITETEVEAKRDKGDVGKGAAVGGVAGAALGAVIGRDVEGTLLGGALGAGAGTVISLGIGSADAVLEAGTEMELRTTERIELE